MNLLRCCTDLFHLDLHSRIRAMCFCSPSTLTPPAFSFPWLFFRSSKPISISAARATDHRRSYGESNVPWEAGSRSNSTSKILQIQAAPLQTLLATSHSPQVHPSPATSERTSSAEAGLGLPQKRMILVDGNAVLYREYFKLLAQVQYRKFGDPNNEGEWVAVVFPTLAMVLQLLELHPSHIAVVFDHPGLTFRHTLYPAYKSNRPPTPDIVQQGLHYTKIALLAMAIKVMEVPGVEADDVIGTLALNALAHQMKVRIVSPDKDFFQILSPDLRLLRTLPRGPGFVSFGLEEFAERFGNLKPSQFVDVMALVGDKVDNVPGVEGIGEKTAIQLITEFGSLEALLEQKENVSSQRARKRLMEEKGEAILCKTLVALRADLPAYMIPYSMQDLQVQKPSDEGESFFQFLKAMASYVEGSSFRVNDLQRRISELWGKL